MATFAALAVFIYLTIRFHRREAKHHIFSIIVYYLLIVIFEAANLWWEILGVVNKEFPVNHSANESSVISYSF